MRASAGALRGEAGNLPGCVDANEEVIGSEPKRGIVISDSDE